MMRKRLKSIAYHRDLIKILAVTNLKASQKNTILGYLWWLLDPVFLMFVYWVLVAILRRGRMYEAYPAFIFCSLMPWKFLNASLSQSVGMFSRYENLIKQVRFSKLALPVSMVLSNFIQCLFGIIPLVVVGAVFGIRPTWRLVLLPLPFVVLLTFTLGLTFFFSAFGVFFRDLENILVFVLRLWWYLSPGLYAISSVPVRYQFLFKLNPIAPVFKAIRAAAYYPGLKTPSPSAEAFPTVELAAVFVISLVIIWVGYLVFRRLEHQFAKEL